MLILTRKKDEKIIIDDNIKITVVAVEGNQVQLGIDAPKDVEIHREEVYRRIEKENIDAVSKRKLDINKLKGFKFNENKKEDNN